MLKKSLVMRFILTSKSSLVKAIATSTREAGIKNQARSLLPLTIPAKKMSSSRLTSAIMLNS